MSTDEYGKKSRWIPYLGIRDIYTITNSNWFSMIRGADRKEPRVSQTQK